MARLINANCSVVKVLTWLIMTSIGLPVPPGFTITTEVCDAYYKNGKKLPAGLMDEVKKSIAMLEKELGKKFGDKTDPLLMSVRSGAAASMPRHDEHYLEPGLETMTQSLAWPTRPRTNALPRTAIAA